MRTSYFRKGISALLAVMIVAVALFAPLGLGVAGSGTQASKIADKYTA